MITEPIEEFYVVGLSVRTTNENNQAARDIPELWSRFFSENVLAGIPNRSGDAVYSLYTEYELDFTKPYTCIIGCRVNSIADILLILPLPKYLREVLQSLPQKEI
nr:effector binding domain-containing protein [Pedobacter sp. SYSU D00535]